MTNKCASILGSQRRRCPLARCCALAPATYESKGGSYRRDRQTDGRTDGHRTVRYIDRAPQSVNSSACECVVAAVASNQSIPDPQCARKLGNASWGVSIAGIVIAILAIVILVAVLVTAASRAAASSVTQPSVSQHAAAPSRPHCRRQDQGRCFPASVG